MDSSQHADDVPENHTPGLNPIVQPGQQSGPMVQPVQSGQSAPQSGQVNQGNDQVKAQQKEIKDHKKKKKLLFVLLGAILFVFFLVFALAFFMLSQGGGSNPLLQLFGLSEEQLYPFLINIANLFFGLFVFISFILAVIGAFMTAMAKRDNKEGKKKGIMLLIVGLICFMFFAMVWAASYFYLQQKKAQYATESQGTVEYIVTTPRNTTNLTAPAVIEFDASKLPVDPLRVTIISYFWDFGDGSTATGSVVSHRYLGKGEADGRYLVTLVVTYRDNKTSEEAKESFMVDVVFVNEKVNAFFTATPETGAIPLVVHFDASQSVDPDGEIESYDWDLNGDGNYGDADGVFVDYTYSKFGTYTVKLRVTDNNKDSSVATKDIVVKEDAKPVASINFAYESGNILYPGKSYFFEPKGASSPNGAIEKYEWDFGDGTVVTRNKNAQHVYDMPGTYTVVLKMTDEEQAIGEVSLEIKVESPESASVAIITTNHVWDDEQRTSITGEVPFSVKFSAEDSLDPDNNIVDYGWDIDGDGVVDGAGIDFEYTYQKAGEYVATLSVEDASGNVTKTSIGVTVEEQSLVASITADTLNGEIPLIVNFDASGSSYPSGKIVNYLWDFGNGITRYDDAQVSYTFNEVGTFTVVVKAIASDGKETTASLFINVLPVSLSACFESNVDSGKAPLIVTFNPGCSSGTVMTYRWDFGDGNLSYTRKPTHTFEKAGTYTVVLTVEDNEGITDSYSVVIAVQD
ncbi:MAG: PKD domain containing protein [Candidatus Peregrinibacteria bacterium GW2011_GWE2_39_6]|nr:MAG: PKD domain containing protein [Candidatus Peregrinibacteria bacterium GW2011_GWE2_39_6]